jgi:hypothetical protein
MGFYPKTITTPANPRCGGVIGDDESHGYDVSITLNHVTTNQLNSLLAYYRQIVANSIYDLNDYNCTTVAIGAFQKLGINLPSTIGNWFGGRGVNPADLGEDIRSMQLSPNLTRNTTGSSYCPSNYGTCQTVLQ